MQEWIVECISRGHRLVPWLGCVLVILSSCQSYDARPLDSALHRDAWHSRALDDGSLTNFVERLAEVEQVDFEFNVQDGLTLSEAQVVAFVFNPELRAERLRAAAASESAKYAGLWNDPNFSFNVLRVNENVPDRWVLNPVLTFKLPLSGSLGAAERVANAVTVAAEQRVAETEWRVHFQVRKAWLEWSAAKITAEETEAHVESMRGLVQTTAQLTERGELLRTEAALFLLEQAQRENELGRMEGEVAALEQLLRGQLGLSPEAPVEFLPVLNTTETLSDLDDYSEAIAARNPRLAHLRLKYEVAEEQLHREIRKQYPDLTLGPQFESEDGQSRIGLQGGLPIPLWNANRQAIEKARFARELARVALETEYELLAGQYAAESARSKALDVQRDGAEEKLAPLVEKQLADALELMRLGEGSSLVLLESLSRAYQVKLGLIEVRKEAALARGKLEYLIGPRAVVVSTPTTEESR